MSRIGLPGRQAADNPPQSLELTPRFYSELVVDRMSQLLLAAEITLSRLNGDMAKQELDLVEPATSQMTEASTGSSQIMRGQLYR